MNPKKGSVVVVVVVIVVVVVVGVGVVLPPDNFYAELATWFFAQAKDLR